LLKNFAGHDLAQVNAGFREASAKKLVDADEAESPVEESRAKDLIGAAKCLINVVKCCRALDRRAAFAEHVEVDAVQHQDFRSHFSSWRFWAYGSHCRYLSENSNDKRKPSAPLSHDSLSTEMP
jgi:hypothetical protein